LWRDQGTRREARDLLVPVYSWFIEGFDMPDLKNAKALLDELGGPRPDLAEGRPLKRTGGVRNALANRTL
jgi:hypothetical protein